MILLLILIITISGGLLSWFFCKWSSKACRLITITALFINLALLIVLWMRHYNQPLLTTDSGWLEELKWNWIPQLGISFHLAIDGLSLLLLILAVFLGIVSTTASWNEIQERIGFFHFNLMLILTGIMGVFMAMDLFLFYFFWEVMLVPMYFFISIWGHENRIYAAIKFFIFTQAGGLLSLYFIHGKTTGNYTFDYQQLLNTSLTKPMSFWLMLGFFVAFAVKLPVVPIHSWLPDAHTQAPTAGSVILAGLLLKTGAYGLLRFVLPFFPKISANINFAIMALAVIGILYGSILAFAQNDVKRLVAYTSISHLGFVLLGIFAGNMLALQGAVIIIFAHGLSTGGLFMVVGALQERIHTRDMKIMGGLWSVLPRTGGVGMFFALASLGLPGLANFAGEFLVLTGTYQTNPFLTIIAAIGFVTSSVYSLWLIHRVFHGHKQYEWKVPDLGLREMAAFSFMIAGIIWLGIYPQPVLNTTKPAIDKLVHYSHSTTDEISYDKSMTVISNPPENHIVVTSP